MSFQEVFSFHLELDYLRAAEMLNVLEGLYSWNYI